jgi:hypothetical protein
MAGGISYCSLNFFTAERRVRALCAQFQPGLAIEQARAIASDNGMSPLPKPSGVSFVVEEKTFGRFGCKITAEGGYIKATEYHFAD